ncbi:MAG: hypothetical protein ABIK40_00400 [candidate division WOR-3 bacterium]
MGFIFLLIFFSLSEAKINKLREFRIFEKFRGKLENWISYRPSTFLTFDKKLFTIKTDIEKETSYIVSLSLLNKEKLKIIHGFKLPTPVSLTNCDNKMIAVGGPNLKQIFIFDTAGKLIDEFLLDFSSLPTMAKIMNETLLIVSGKSFEYGIEIYNLKNGNLIRKIFKIPSYIKNLIKKGLNHLGFQVGFDITPQGNLIVTTSVDPYIYEYDIFGKLLFIYKDYPENYIPLKKVPPLDIKEEIKKEQNTKKIVKEEFEKWIKLWTVKGVPMVFNKNYFLIQRNWYPPYYLDFYSISERKYIGSIKTNYVLLYAMPYENLFYLVESAEESLLTIGEYEMEIESKEAILKIEDDINSTFSSILKEGILNILMIATPFDCGFYELLKEVRGLKNIDYNFLILISHDNFLALSKYCSRLEKNLNQKVIPVLNLASYLRKKGIIHTTPALLIFDKNKKFITNYDLYSQTPFKKFLSSLYKTKTELKVEENKIKKKKILFLCDRNLLSFIAQQEFKNLIKEEYETYSAGIFPVDKLDENLIQIFNEIGINPNEYQPRELKEFLKEDIDYLIILTENAKREVEKLDLKYNTLIYHPFFIPSSENKEDYLAIKNKIKEWLFKTFNLIE